MYQFDRRAVVKSIGFLMLSPIFLRAKEELGTQSAIGKYELTKDKSGSLTLKSDAEEVRFRVGTSALMLRKKSQVEFQTDGIGVKSLKLLNGGAMAVFGKGDKTIETKTFTAGIRGTGIYLEEQDSDAVYSCLCYGKADYMSPSGSLLTSLSTIHHDRPLSIAKTKDGKSEFFSDKTNNHTDDELRILEKMCSREVPFEEYLRNRALLSPEDPYSH